MLYFLERVPSFITIISSQILAGSNSIANAAGEYFSKNPVNKPINLVAYLKRWSEVMFIATDGRGGGEGQKCLRSPAAITIFAKEKKKYVRIQLCPFGSGSGSGRYYGNKWRYALEEVEHLVKSRGNRALINTITIWRNKATCIC